MTRADSCGGAAIVSRRNSRRKRYLVRRRHASEVGELAEGAPIRPVGNCRLGYLVFRRSGGLEGDVEPERLELAHESACSLFG